MYVREPLSYVVSKYRQQIKRRTLTANLPEFALSYRPQFFTVAERWAAVFGRENVMIRKYGRDCGCWNIVSDFANLIGLKELGDDVVSNHVYEFNPSLAGNLLFMKRTLNRYITHEENISIRNEIRKLRYLDITFRGKMPVDQETVELIVRQNSEDIESLERCYGVSVRSLAKPVEGPACPDLGNLDRDFERILNVARKQSGHLAPLLERISIVFDKG